MNLIFNNYIENWNQYGLSTIETDTSDNDENTFEIDVMPQKKHFITIQEKQQFIEEYKKKKKTELCKNFVMTGKCKYGNDCSFAHGYNELKPKTHLHQKYKTKPCIRFFYQGHCPYGIRCQYIHGELINNTEFDGFLYSSYKEFGMKAPISSKYLKTEQRKDIQRFILKMSNKNIDQELFINSKSRLPFFKQLTDPLDNFLSDDSQNKFEIYEKQL